MNSHPPTLALGEAFEGTVGAKPGSVSVGVMNKGVLEDGHDHVAEGVMHDPVAIGSRRN